jgi:3-mercaptopropionate dioxygenase
MIQLLPTMPEKLQRFIRQMTELVSSDSQEADVLGRGRLHLQELIARDDWLPAPFAQVRPDRYAQYLLYCDPAARFSVVSFVWANDQKTPVHNHTVWGLVGVLRGTERCESVADGHCHDITPGQIDAVSPTIGDWHRVSNVADPAQPKAATVSIHVYGGDIGKIRRQRLADNGDVIEFVSGYDNTLAQSFA